MAKYAFIDGQRIRKAHSVRRIDPIFQDLAVGLARIRELRYIKIFPERLTASSILSQDGKKNPVVKVGAEGLVGVELLVDESTKVVQFYALTSAVKGCGRLREHGLVHEVVDEPQVFPSNVPVGWEATSPDLAIVRGLGGHAKELHVLFNNCYRDNAQRGHRCEGRDDRLGSRGAQPAAAGVRAYRRRPAPHLLMQVRPVKRANLPQIARLYYETVRRVNARDYGPEQIRALAPRVYPDAFWQRRFRRYEVLVAEDGEADHSSAVLVAKDGGAVVGFVELRRAGEIDCFYVHHGHQHRGIGSALIARVEREARSRGNTRSLADVSITAEPFFYRLGFRVTRRQTKIYRNRAFKQAVMEKRLRRAG